MFSKITPKIKDYYFLPMLITVPLKTSMGGYEGYIKYKDKTFTEHTYHSFMHAVAGMISGAFLGAVWPISLPIFIARQFDKSQYITIDLKE